MTARAMVPIRIGLVHAVTPAIAPIHAAFARQWPEATLQNVLDDGLPAALQEEGGSTTRIRQRVLRLTEVAADHAAAVLFTCTAFDEAIDAARSSVTVPVLKPNEAMLNQALACGRTVGLIATFEPAVQPMEAALLALAKSKSLEVTAHTVCVPEAMAAARSGDVARHDTLVAKAAPALAHCDVILLAQFSTSTALQAVSKKVSQQVLSAPDSAVIALWQLLRP
jgi:hypothetical protein